MSPRAGRGGEAAALAALALLVVCLTVSPISNNDIFLHLKTGEIVLASHGVPIVDDYSALARGRPFVAHEWLAGVLFHLVRGVFGWNGLILLQTMVAVVVAGLLYGAARRLGAPAPWALAPLAFVMILAASRFMERPHIFTYLMTAAFLFLLARPGAPGAATIAILAALQIVWVNLHAGFVLGPAIAGLAALSARLDRSLPRPAGAAPSPSPRPPAGRLLILTLVLAAACLANPYGWRLLRFPFQLTGSSFMGEIYEWLPPLVVADLRAGAWAWSPYASTYMARYYVVWIVVGLLAYGGAFLRWRRTGAAPPGGTLPGLLFVLFLGLSLRMNRNVADFALATLPGVAATLAASFGRGLPEAVHPGAPEKPGGGARRTAIVLPLVLVLLAALFAIRGYPFSPSLRRRTGLGLGANIPVAAADYLEGAGVRGAVFNTYASGAYLVYRLYPRVRVAMDSRNDVYGEDLYRLYNRALVDADTLDDLLKRLDAGAILLEWPEQGMMTAAAVVHRLKDWVPVYFDDVAVVYLRPDGPYGGAAARDGYTLLDPALYRGGAIRKENAARALAEAERALQRRPSYIGRVMKIDALFGLGRDQEAIQEENSVLREDPPLFHIYVHLGWVRLARGDRAEAAARFRRALALQPDSQVAWKGLSLARPAPAP